MKHALFMMAVLSALPLAASAARPDSSTIRFVIGYPVDQPAKARELSKWLVGHDYDIAGINRNKRELEVITNERGVAALRAHGLRGHVAAVVRTGLAAESGLDERYLNPDRLVARLQELNSKAPDITRLVELGKSIQGRPVLALLISTTPGASDPRYFEKPSIMIDALHHAREIMTTEIAVDMAAQLLAGAASGNEKARKTIADWNIWVIPMLNIDGNNIVWTSNSMWRKNAHEADGQVHGVDINRNYPFRWASCNGSSSNKGAENYRGEAGGSEPETQAIVQLADAIVPTASLSYHSYSELVLYPMGCDGEVSGENAMIDRLGHELADRLPSDSGGGNYTPGTPWQVLYAVDGDSMDYLFGAHGTLAYTFEVNQEFQPSYELREPTLAKHRVAWQYFLDKISANLLAVKVLDLKSGQATPAQIEIASITHSKGELPFHTNSAGNYFKVLDPGHYSIVAKLSDGRTGALEVDMAGQPNHVTLTVQ